MIPELDADPDVKQRLRESPKLWVRNALKHPIDPSRQYDFKTGDGEPLTHILDSESWIHPDQWGDINVLLLARGELKSTSTGWIESWLHDAYPQAHSYIIAPNSGQVKDFLEPIKETYIEMADMDSRRVTNNKQKQVFKTYQRDSEGSVDPVMGRIQSDSGYSEESVRGKHSQFGLTEETQDLTENVFNIFLPAIDQQLPSVSYFPTVFCIGTPKVTGSFYHELWDRSDKRTWDAETESWIQQESVDPYELSAEEIAELPGDIELEDGESYTVRGWHVDWFNSPLHSDADIARARKRMDDMEFANEVLAEFHEPEDNLLTTDDIRSTFSDEYAFRESPYNSDNKTVVVADWGGGTDQNASDTVLMAAEEIEYTDGQQSEYVVCELLFLDPNENRIRDEIQQYEDLLIKFDADVGLVDYGYGQQAMESLQHGDDTKDDSGYMNTVSAAKYGNVTDRTDIKWTTDDTNNKLFFTCDKSRSCTQMVESFRDDRWIIPRPDMSHSNADGVRLIDQLTAPYKTLSEGRKTGNKSVVIETPGNHRDDAFDLFTLAFLAFNTVSSDENIIQFSSSPRTGG
jgi:hypothetical protein